jgi:hypothetical protein
MSLVNERSVHAFARPRFYVLRSDDRRLPSLGAARMAAGLNAIAAPGILGTAHKPN